MPPRKFSRHTFTTGIVDEYANNLLTDRRPYTFRSLGDNVQHVVKEGETLFTIAGQEFFPMPRPAGLWWIIADFQPIPIHDPTLKLTPGRVLFVPSLRTVQEDILSERRRLESQ